MDRFVIRKPKQFTTQTPSNEECYKRIREEINVDELPTDPMDRRIMANLILMTVTKFEEHTCREVLINPVVICFLKPSLVKLKEDLILIGLICTNHG